MAKRVRIVIKLNETDPFVKLDKSHTSFQDIMECLSHAGLVKCEPPYNDIEFSPPEWIPKKKQWQWAQRVRDRAKSFGLHVELKEIYQSISDLSKLGDEPIRTKIIPYEEILMLTNGLYPKRYCPQTNEDELRGVVIEEHGKLSLKIGRGFESPKQGHKAFLIETDPQGRTHYQMDTGLNERRMVYGSLRGIQNSAKILVAGLGLGIISLQLAKKPRTIHVVEVNPNVKTLIWHKLTRWCDCKGYAGKLSIEDNDIQTHLRFTSNLYNVIYLDIWDKIDKTTWDDVLSLESLARNRLNPNGRVITWARKRLERTAIRRNK